MSGRRIGRREFIGSLAGAAVAAAARAADQKRRPNVIFAFSDEHRFQSLPFTETPAVQAPHMTRLANEGCTFTHCVSNYPVCSPYRAILMTGRWPYENGVIDNSIDLSPKQATLGKCFRDAGYRTGYIGKWHLGGNRAERFGFDHSLIWTGTNKHLSSRYHPAKGRPVDTNSYNATLMTNQALEFISQNKDKPFMLMLSWNPPHSDFLDAPKEKQALYPEGSLPWRPNVPAESEQRGSEDSPAWNRSSEPYMRGYHAHISAIDDDLGRLLALLDQLGIADDTIFVYTSDHGSQMGSHGLGGKRLPYEEAIRVPLIVRWPGQVEAGLKREGLIGAMDLMPTLCGLAGLPAPAQCRGRDLSGVITGKDSEPDAPQLLMHISKANASGGDDHPGPIFRGVRTNRHTYAVLETGPWLLFDNVEDPFQMNNRLNDPALASVRGELHTMLGGMLKQAGDSFLL